MRRAVAIRLCCLRHAYDFMRLLLIYRDDISCALICTTIRFAVIIFAFYLPPPFDGFIFAAIFFALLPEACLPCLCLHMCDADDAFLPDIYRRSDATQSFLPISCL